MFGRFFDYNGDGRSDLFEIATGMGAMGLFDDEGEERDPDDDAFDDDGLCDGDEW